MDELTLPGTIPGLLEVGSRVVCDGQAWVITSAADLGWNITRVCDSLNDVALAHELDLALRHAASRDRAARWLVRHGNSNFLNRGPGLYASVSGVSFSTVPIYRAVFSAGQGVPALATLDPHDPRLLGDGSRWVDAEALRVCVLAECPLDPCE